MSKMRQWSLMTVVAVLVVFVAGWFLLVKPQKSKAATLKSQATTQNSENQTILTKIASLQSEQRQLPAQQLALQKFSTEVPDTANEPILIRQLSESAQGAGVNLVSMTPGTAATVSSTTSAGAASLANPASGATLTALPISLGVIGSYANLESFYQSLETLPRAILVYGWDMCQVQSTNNPASGAGGSCTAPTVPSNINPPTGTLGATLSAEVFYAAPPAATQTAGPTATGTTGTTGSTTTGSSTTTPSTTSPSTAPTTAATNAASTAATSATTS